MLQKARVISKKLFQTDDVEIRYDCTTCYHVLYMNYANGILFGL